MKVHALRSTLIVFGLFGLVTNAVASCSDTASETPTDASTTDVNTVDASATPSLDATDATSPDATPSPDAGPRCLESDGAQPAILIASGQSNPGAIAVDGTSVYWANSGNGTIVKCPLAGCPDGGPPQVVVQGQASPWELEVTSSDVIWSNFFGTVRKCPKDGCSDAGPYSFPASSTAGLTIDDARVYWTEFATGRVAACPLGGCTDATVLYQGAPGPAYGITVDGTNVYWPNNPQARLLSAPLTGVPDGGDPRLLAQDPNPNYATVTATHIYWTNSADPGSVKSAPLDGGPDGSTPTPFAEGPHARAVVYDRACDTIYWAMAGANLYDGGIFRCPAGGCGDSGPSGVALHQDGPNNVVLDDAFVYWTNYTDGTVWKRAK